MCKFVKIIVEEQKNFNGKPLETGVDITRMNCRMTIHPAYYFLLLSINILFKITCLCLTFSYNHVILG